MSFSKVVTLLSACTITAGGFLLTSPAFGYDRDVIVKGQRLTEYPTRYVRYSDLNLLHQAGVETLNRRVKTAVRDVCMESVGPNGDFYIEMNCRSSAWGGARPQIDRAIARAQQIAANGFSTIAPVTISISLK